MDYRQRKQWRVDYFNRYVKGWKLEKCVACNGSGYYDNKGSPRCGSCDGTGKSRVAPTTEPRP